MKKLFMAIFIPVLIVLGTPAMVATLMYDGTGEEHMPTHLYTEDADAKQMLFTELDNSISDVEDGTTEDMIFNLHEDIINTAIYEYFKEENPNYAPGPDCQTDQQCYVFAEAQQIEGYDLSLRVVGAWVSFYDGASQLDPGRFVLNVFLEVDINSDVTYKTVLEVHFLFEDDPDYYYLEFDKIQMGRLPIPKSLISSIVGMVDEQANLNLDQELSTLPIGDFDLDNISYTIPKDDILAQMASSQGDEEDPGADLAQELLSIIFDQQLVKFDLEDEEFKLTTGVSQFKNNTPVAFPEYLYELHDQEIVDSEVVIGEYNPELFSPEEHLQDLFTNYIFNSALLDSGFRIEEEIFNKLIYSSQNGFTEMRTIQEIPISDTETKNIEFGLKAIWFEMEDTNIYINALFRIGEIDSLLVIRADEVSVSDQQLKFEFVEITAGKDPDESNLEYLEIVDLEVFKAVFADLGDVEFGEFNADGDLIITAERLTKVLEDGSNQGVVVVDSIDLVPGAIVLDVSAANSSLQATLETFQDAVESVLGSDQLLTDLDTVLDTTDGGTEQAVYDSVQNIQTALSTSQEVSSEDVDALVENIQDLDPATQQEVLESMTNLMDSTTLSEFESIFGTFNDTNDSTTE
ncbi:MAG: hypothetical protein K9L26_02570 [Candidatus Izimaplasma sp.]|nr:hypothetical protein [Candidatus Izimaplasma bacterium]